MLAQVAPLALLALVLAGVGAWTAQQVVERTADRLLAGSVRAILEGVSAQDGAIRVDLAPWALGLLDGPERDTVFYSVRQGRRLITGYDDIPPVPVARPDETAFLYPQVRGVRVRLAAQTLAVPGFDPPVTVAVAQSLDSRRAVLWRLLLTLSLLPILIVGAGALLLRPATHWGLRPVRRLTRSLVERSGATSADFAAAETRTTPIELISVVEAFNRLLGSLEKSTRDVRQFASDASHQLRTPLSVITANLQIVQDGRRDWTNIERALLGDSVEASQRLAHLLTQLLSLARSGRLSMREPLDIGRVARAAAATVAMHHRHIDHPVRARIPATPMPFAGDVSLIIEMMTNVLDNALIHSGQGQAFLLARDQSDWREVVIWDHGHGVADDDLPHLFERHFQGRKEDEVGSGLGLAIVKALADSHGVEVKAMTRLHRSGLVVIFCFPREAPLADPLL